MEDVLSKATWHTLETGEMKLVTAADLQAELVKAGYGWVKNAQVSSSPLVKDAPELLIGVLLNWKTIPDFRYGMHLRYATHPELRAWAKKFPLQRKTTALNTRWINSLGQPLVPFCEFINGQTYWTMCNSVEIHNQFPNSDILMIFDPQE